MKESIEDILYSQICSKSILVPQRQYRISAVHVGGDSKGIKQRIKDAGLKDWRIDFAWPELKLAVEVQGGGWIGGRHTRGAGYAADLIRKDAILRMGWSIYECDGSMVKSGKAVDTIGILIKLKDDSDVFDSVHC